MSFDLPPVDQLARVGVTLPDVLKEERPISPPQHLDLGTLTVTLKASRGVPTTSVEDEQAFHQLAAQWRSETKHMSLAADKAEIGRAHV